MTTKVLLVEDNPGDARLIQELLLETDQGSELEITWTKNSKNANRNLARCKFDVVLLDLSLPDSNGLETFRSVVDQCQEAALIILTGWDDSSAALKAVAEGAQDYLIKGSYDGNQLYRSIVHAIERQKLRLQLEQSESRFKRNIKSTLKT
jgi:DNA-binding NtrC family response regulator